MTSAKKIARDACLEMFGFAPAMSKIEIIDVHMVNGQEQYIRFEVNGHEYGWDTYTMEHTEPWNR